MRKRSPARFVSYGYLLLNTLCWGAALVISKPALDITTPMRFLMYRYAFALPLSLPFIWHYRSFLKLKNIRTITTLETLGTTISLALLYAGLAQTTAIEASLLSNTTPIFIVLAGVFFLKEKQERNEWLGLAIAFMATIFLTVVPSLEGVGMSSISLRGNLYIILQNITTAWYFILAKSSYSNLPKFFVTSISYIVGLISFFAFSLVEAGSLSTLVNSILTDFSQPTVVWASLYMAIFGSILGLTAYIKGQDGVEASEASIFWYLQPAVYIPLGILLLGEVISITQAVALFGILIGVIIAGARFKTLKR